MASLSFSIPVNPAELPTAQQKGIRIVKCHGRMMPMFYEKKNVKDAHCLLARELKRHAPPVPIADPVELRVQYNYPFPKGTPKCRMSEATPMVQRPDVDNSQKLVQDVMSEVGFWNDDSQVWALTLVKVRTTLAPSIGFDIRY